MLPMINWANVGIDPTLMGIQQGQNIFAQGQDAYRQGIINRNMPDQLREALMAQQLQNQQQQVNLDFLPKEKRAALTAQLQQNQYYPKLQESLLGQRGLSNQLTQLQIDQLKQAGSPEALALARQMEEEKLRSQQALTQQRLARAGLGGFSTGGRGAGGGVMQNQFGEISAPLTRAAQTKTQLGVMESPEVAKKLIAIGQGEAPYMQPGGFLKELAHSIADYGRPILPERVFNVLGGEEGVNTLQKKREAVGMKKEAMDQLVKTFGLSSTNYFGKTMLDLIEKNWGESGASYEKRLSGVADRLLERQRAYEDALLSGLSLEQAYQRAGFSKNEARAAATYDRQQNPNKQESVNIGVNQYAGNNYNDSSPSQFKTLRAGH